jgi:two-component system response regulator AtoC
MPETVLVVDDDPAVGRVLSGLLSQAGWRSRWVSSGAAALAELQRLPTDLVITDLRMEGMNGMELLARTRAEFPDIPVVVLTAHGTVPIAVEAMKAGAADFLLKPFDREEVLYTVRKALTHATATAARPSGSEQLLGSSPAMQEVLDQLRRVAPGASTVLLRGESGVGKELAARALHQLGARRDKPFVAVHCAALPETLLESELFGYEKGAFTGAASRKPGRVELAAGGTLFFDEIGEIPPAIQVKLLRLLQERTYERLGGAETCHTDVRFVAATHGPLEELVKQGRFREDLFYRLNVVPIFIPPLRERREEIPDLARHFCAQDAAANAKSIQLDPGALQLLSTQAWPGNVRELQNFIERLVLFSDGPLIGESDVRRELGRRLGLPSAPAQQGGDLPGTLDAQRRQVERDAVVAALQEAKGNRSAAARLLGISRRTFYNKLEEHGLT